MGEGESIQNLFSFEHLPFHLTHLCREFVVLNIKKLNYYIAYLVFVMFPVAAYLTKA